MSDHDEVFVGIDVAKLRNAVAVADGGRMGEVRYLGEFDADESGMRRLVKRLTAKHEKVTFCYEAGPTGYGLHRLIQSMGFECTIVAPSLIPRRPGDQVKTNRRDAIGLARLLRAGELTAVWVPDSAWARFARTGNPGWPAYNPKTRATMVFDAESKVVNDPNNPERELFATKLGYPGSCC